jgi:hypothetical protein
MLQVLFYFLATPLFSDYAEKARTVSIPTGTKIVISSNGLTAFPQGTILTKTFFYWKDKRDTSLGRIIVETRTLEKTATGWQAATHTAGGHKKTINWISEDGHSHTQTYIVPQSKQCISCHGEKLEPLGFKARNINIKDLVKAGVLDISDTLKIPALPNWEDTSLSLDKRARAYLDMNCAHCHSATGMCKRSDLRFAFENTLEQTNLLKHTQQILKYMQNGRMPLLGTHVVHREGVALIAKYIATLQ